MLDVALLVGLVVVYKVTWTGITWHEWIAIAAIVPLLMHFIVNWEWAVRVARTFIERLVHASRLNFVIDCLLMLAMATAMVSGFMVAPALLAPFGIHPANPYVWHVVHAWVANVTITVLLTHAALHWRFLFNASRRLLADIRPPARVARETRALPGAARAGRTNVPASSSGERRSRIGVRAAQAARERAMALRVVSVLGVTAALCVAIASGVGLAAPLFGSAAQAQHAASKTGKLVCPKTGCTASTCHAGSGLSPAVFYSRTAASKPHHRSAAKAKRQPVSPRRVATPHASPTNRRVSATKAVATAPKKAPAQRAAAPAAPKPAAPKPAARVAPKKRFVCPVTGCARSSCHATYGKSAAAFY